jgi:hypothetical protein
MITPESPEGSSVYTGPMSILFDFGNPLTGRDSLISVIGPDGEDIGTPEHIALPYIHDRPYMELSIGAHIYTIANDGVFLYPGRLREEFPQDTPFTLIVNPRNMIADAICTPGSLFYIQRTSRFHTVETHVVENSQPIGSWIVPNGGSRDLYMFHTFRSYDQLPTRVAHELLLTINPNYTISNSIPEYLENCNRSNYPSIHFRFVEERSGEYQHTGTIVYWPDDYLEEPTADGRCRFKIRWGASAHFGLNFLNMVATHLKSDQVGFCDPL